MCLLAHDSLIRERSNCHYHYFRIFGGSARIYRLWCLDTLMERSRPRLRFLAPIDNFGIFGDFGNLLPGHTSSPTPLVSNRNFDGI